MKKRFTYADLLWEIGQINKWFEADNFSVRLEAKGRYGACAVDEYCVNPDGSRNGSGVLRTVATGTAKECKYKALEAYNERFRAARRENII
jgi:hypothetical protein